MDKTKPKSQTCSSDSDTSMFGEGGILKGRAERLRGGCHLHSRWQILLKDRSMSPVLSQGFTPSFIDLHGLCVVYLKNHAKNASQLG